jgi:glycosyltransferase involved in cell wall biosynthesis
MCRDDRTTSKIVKSFYLKYPLYSFVTFRDIKNMSRQDLAGVLNEYFLSVWVDETSSFGTFPVESMKCGTPVIGKVPMIQPEWISEKNGVWLFDELQIPEAIAIFCKNFFEDLEDTELLNEMKTIDSKYSEKEQVKQIKEVYTQIFDNRISELKTNIQRLGEENK